MLAVAPRAAFAEADLTALVRGDMTACTTNCVPELLNNLFVAGLAVGAMLAVLRIAYAGWLYMGSADMWSNKSEAIEVFRNAILGLLLLLGVWLILFQINPDILNLDFTRSLHDASTPTATP